MSVHVEWRVRQADDIVEDVEEVFARNQSARTGPDGPNVRLIFCRMTVYLFLGFV